MLKIWNILLISALILLSGCNSWDYNAIPEIADHDEMIAYCTPNIEKTPDDPRYYFFRGLAYSEKNEYDKAIADYTKAIALDLTFLDSYYNRGICYFKQQKYDDAISNFRIVAQRSRRFYALSPTMEGFAYSMLGSIYMAQEQYDESLRYLNDASRLIPNDINLLSKKAQVFFYLKEYQKSFQLSRQLVEKYPDDQSILFNYIMSMLFCEKQELVNQKELEKYSLYYFEHFPKNYHSFVIMAKLNFQLKKFDLSEQYLQDAFKHYDAKLVPDLLDRMNDLQKELAAAGASKEK